MKFHILDTRDVWHGPAMATARSRGYAAQRIFRGDEVDSAGVGFIRPHADPVELAKNQHDWDLMSSHLTMIQDVNQVRLYENKSAQFERWARWMPPTWRFTDLDAALSFLGSRRQWPLVSKADVGASSVNVRILRDRDAAIAHARALFGPGIQVKHCSIGPGRGDAISMQRGYALLQEFIPHEITWRVNAIGSKRALFQRYCYQDKPVAQTGNVDPVMEMTPHAEAVLRFANLFFAEADTRWCAVDILQKWDRLFILESSLAWPWPSPGRCNGAPFLNNSGQDTGRKWIEMFDVMFDEVEAGVWQKT